MTKETSIPESLKKQIASAGPKTTVFSDGSTFDYENGYQNNGAPVAVRNRTEKPTIVKSHTVFTEGQGFQFVGWTLVLLAIASAVGIGITNIQKAANIAAVKDNINSSGKAKVVQAMDSALLVQDLRGGYFKCDLSMLSNESDPTAYVFCAPGQSATFTIPLPHDPSDIFYNRPTEETKSVKKS